MKWICWRCFNSRKVWIEKPVPVGDLTDREIAEKLINGGHYVTMVSQPCPSCR